MFFSSVVERRKKKEEGVGDLSSCVELLPYRLLTIGALVWSKHNSYWPQAYVKLMMSDQMILSFISCDLAEHRLNL